MQPKTSLPLCATATLVLASCASDHRRSHQAYVDSLFCARAETEPSLPIDLGAGEVLALDFDRAAVDVRVATGEAPRVRVLLRMPGRTEAEARELLAGFELRGEHSSGRLRFFVAGEPVRVEHAGRWGRASVTTLVPAVEVHASVPARSALEVRSSSGPIAVDGPLGSCDLETRHGSISLVDAEGELRLASASGSLSVEGLRGEVRLETRHGSIQIDAIRAVSLAASTESGSIAAQAIEAEDIYLASRHGEIELLGASGRVHATTGSGAILGRDLVGSVEAESRYGSLELHGVFSLVRATSGSGGVVLDALGASRAAADWLLSTRHGSIRASLPAGFSAELSAHTRHGTIRSALPIRLRHSEAGAGARLEGRIGAGGRRLELETTSGNIEVALGPHARRRV